MGNTIPSKASSWVTVMKLDGETIKLKAPVSVEQVIRDYPNHVVLHSDAVRHLGTKVKPLQRSTQLQPKQLCFLVGISHIEDLRAPNRARSDISMTAKSRLESMLLTRRSNSDIIIRTSAPQSGPSSSSHSGEAEGPTRVKVRMTKSKLTQMTSESNNSSETAQKILDFLLNDGEAQKNVTVTQNIEEIPRLGNISDASKKTLRNRVRFSTDVQRVEA